MVVLALLFIAHTTFAVPNFVCVISAQATFPPRITPTTSHALAPILHRKRHTAELSSWTVRFLRALHFSPSPAFAFFPPRPSPRPALPNLADWGYGDLGANGFGAETPNLDRLAAEGMRLTCVVYKRRRCNCALRERMHPCLTHHPFSSARRDMHANSVCTPSRAALQTGRYNMRTGIHGNFDTDSTGGLALEEVTIGAFLSASPLRYHTFAGGKVRFPNRAAKQARRAVPQNTKF